MDIYCSKCGEPWDMDCLHEEAEIRVKALNVPIIKISSEDPVYSATYNEVRKDFQKKGCCVLGGKCSNNKASGAISAAYDLMGDDLDGAASILDDARYLGLLD